jgi:hypothetical protein
VTGPEPSSEEDVLLRYAKLGRLRRMRRGRYVAGGFVVASGPGRAEVHQQAQQQQAQQALVQQLAASGALIVESGGAATDTRFEQYREQEFARQFLERAARQQIKGGDYPVKMLANRSDLTFAANPC